MERRRSPITLCIDRGAPWQMRITDELRSRVVALGAAGVHADAGSNKETRRARQTVLQRVKRGELEAVLAWHGRLRAGGQAGGGTSAPL